jgi:hypothetical protein
VHGCRRSRDWWEMDGQEHAYRDKSDFNGEAFMLAKLSLGLSYDEQVQLSVVENPNSVHCQNRLSFSF